MRKGYIIVTLSIIYLLVACTSSEVVRSELNWFTNLEDAKAEAQIWKCPIFIDFTGSDWCGWCIALEDEVFSQPEFIDYTNNNLNLVKLDIPSKIKQIEATKKYNTKVATKYGIRAFSTIVLLNMAGNYLARTGYQYGGVVEYVKLIQELVRKQ